MNGGAILFALPSTPLVRVVYIRDGVQQGAVISNPRTRDRLQAVMLARNVGMSQVQFIEALPERKAVR